MEKDQITAFAEALGVNATEVIDLGAKDPVELLAWFSKRQATLRAGQKPCRQCGGPVEWCEKHQMYEHSQACRD